MADPKKIVEDAGIIYMTMNETLKDLKFSKSAVYLGVAMLNKTHSENSPELYKEIENLLKDLDTETH